MDAARPNTMLRRLLRAPVYLYRSKCNCPARTSFSVADQYRPPYGAAPPYSPRSRQVSSAGPEAVV